MDMIIATHNKHKVEEFSRILAPLGVKIRTAELTEAEETGTTFRENAYIKAKAACDETGLPCIADDSGLSVDALNGEPGVYSARYAEEGKRVYLSLEANKLHTDGEGRLHLGDICAVAGLGPGEKRDGSVAYYLSEPRVDDDSKGVGPFMMARSEYLLATQAE